MAANAIIYLNGPSSAGKTTLARALQARLPEPYLHVGIDTLIGLMPEHLNDWTGERAAPGYYFEPVTDAEGHATFRVAAGPYGAQIFPAFRAMVLALARSGLRLIIDDVAFGAAQVARWRETLDGIPTLWVGVTADPATLIAREAARGDRLVGSARDQIARVHAGVTYDLFLDTTALTIDAAAERIAEHLELATGDAPPSGVEDGR